MEATKVQKWEMIQKANRENYINKIMVVVLDNTCRIDTDEIAKDLENLSYDTLLLLSVITTRLNYKEQVTA